MVTTGEVEGGGTDAWVDVGDGCDLALRDGRLVCRHQAGECAATVETWMLFTEAWQAWQRAQENPA